MQQRRLSEGIQAVIDYCLEFRKGETVKKYVKACNEIESYYVARGTLYYSADISASIRTDLCRNEEIYGYRNHRYIYRTLGMLDDYYSDKSFRITYAFVNRYKHILQLLYEEYVEEFKDSLTIKSNSISYVSSISRDFFFFLQQMGITDLSIINQETLYTFLRWEYSDHKGSMDNVMYTLRLICSFLREKGFANIPFELLPFNLPPVKSKIYPAFSSKDMENILSEPDTNTIIGKRDYAVLVLSSFTGMRAIDIANLTLADIKWKEKTIHFIQSKTGNGLALPLEDTAAFAVSDYILNGRPNSDSPYVFLTKTIPFRKLGDKSGVANILNKYIKQASIVKEPYDGKSFHAFRRNMGSWLLDTSADPELISQILGHHSRDVLQRYLPITTSKLEICALNLDGIEIRTEVYL